MITIEASNRIRQMNPWILTPSRAKELLSPFLPERYVMREIDSVSAPHGRALLVAGPRQAGKSTLVWQQAVSFSPDILFLNMEDPLLRIACSQPIDVIEHLRNDYPFVRALFIDEVQHIEEAGLFIKALVDAKLNMKIWVTGSSSFDLKSKTRESLAGRASRRYLLPFSLWELRKQVSAGNPIAEKHACDTILSHQLIFGGYPAVYLSLESQSKQMILSDLVEALILRDASDLFKIKRVDAFRKLLTLLSGQIGNLINISELASICNVDAGTINSHIEILHESHIVRRLLPFSGGKRREITSASKVYFIDNGIRNQLLNNLGTDIELRIDRGALFENWAFSEICKALSFQDSIRFWRSKSGAEVDFVIEHAGRIYGLEVKYTRLKHPEISRSSWSFIEGYDPDDFAVLNMDLDYSFDSEKGRVEFITPMTLGKWVRKCLESAG
ncbi:MAG: ATP-binding protein [Desulfobacteraceae bacterium]|jgi:predicted AAA+ superfamily ATPase|nr:MAG: ATP-binding protein [Desulfobacteraceae bacterium]